MFCHPEGMLKERRTYKENESYTCIDTWIETIIKRTQVEIIHSKISIYFHVRIISNANAVAYSNDKRKA